MSPTYDSRLFAADGVGAGWDGWVVLTAGGLDVAVSSRLRSSGDGTSHSKPVLHILNVEYVFQGGCRGNCSWAKHTCTPCLGLRPCRAGMPGKTQVLRIRRHATPSRRSTPAGDEQSWPPCPRFSHVPSLIYADDDVLRLPWLQQTRHTPRTRCRRGRLDIMDLPDQ